MQIAAREQELRRKEEELLQAMREAGAREVGTREAGPSAAQDTAQTTPKKVVVQEQSVAAQVEQVSVQADDELVEADEHQQLRALEHHPALRSKKPEASLSSQPVPGTIKTHSVESQPDGTTARRLGTYTRVNRDNYEWPRSQRATAQAHTVSLGEIQHEASIRSVSLAHEEVATIRNNVTHLRTGPSRLDTNLLSLPQYSEVSIDYRSGSWYRVKTTQGVRGWVPGTALLFDAGISPRSAVRVGAIQGKVR